MSEQPDQQDVVSLVKRLQQQISFLEKKIDLLIAQSQTAVPRARHFSKPYRSFDRSHQYDKGDREGGFRERGPVSERHFEKRHGEEGRDFGYKKKIYDHSHGSSSAHARHSERPRGAEDRGLGPKKKPFYHGRRDWKH